MKRWLEPVRNNEETRAAMGKIFSNCLAYSHHETLAVIFYLLPLSKSGNQKHAFNVQPSSELKPLLLQIATFPSFLG